MHGLRKAAAVRLSNAGCSNDEQKAITGHRTDSELARYNKARDQGERARPKLRMLPVLAGVGRAVAAPVGTAVVGTWPTILARSLVGLRRRPVLANYAAGECGIDTTRCQNYRRNTSIYRINTALPW
jgi:hypothetical protein